MSDTVAIEELIREAGLEDKVERINDSMWCMRRGSAMVIVGTAGPAIVAIAPLFSKLPDGRELEFCQLLLSLNAGMGGVASFAIQNDGWVVLHAGRGIKGMDAQELSILVGTVGKFADDFDDQLYNEFFKDDAEVLAPTENDAKPASTDAPTENDAKPAPAEKGAEEGADAPAE